MKTWRQGTAFKSAADATAWANKQRCTLCRSWLEAKSMEALCSPQVQAALSKLRPKHQLVRLHIHSSSKHPYLNIVADLITNSSETKRWYIRTKKIGRLTPI